MSEGKGASSSQMSGVSRGFIGTIGNTPMIRLETLSAATQCNILAKAEHMNPGGSVKDRAAKYMIEKAAESGLLKPGGYIVEGTAGNTGIGLVLLANSMGYKTLFTVPDKVSQEKIDLLRNLGAIVEVGPTVGLDDPRNFIRAAPRRAEELDGFNPNQFYNENNFRAHYETTGPEIWKQTDGKVDAVIMAAGTGGTLGGISTYLKEQNSSISCWLMDVWGAGVKYVKNAENKIEMVLKTAEEKQKEGSTQMEGIGSPEVFYSLGRAKLDGVMRGDDQLAFEMVHYLLKNEGIFVGPSAAYNCLGALWLGKLLGPGHTIVTVLCDGGNNYKSKVFNEAWLKEKNILIQRNTIEELLNAFEENQAVRVRI